MNNSLKKIGERIKTLREERNMTQKELGNLIGTTQSAIARMENGEQNLSIEMFSKISKALGKEIVHITGDMLNIEIEGNKRLKGTAVTSASKNGAVGLLAASLLNDGKTILKNVPQIEEVNRIIEVLQSIGVSVTKKGNSLEIISPKTLSISSINKESAGKTRSIIMLIGPLLHKKKQFSLPQTGGCILGARSVRPHFFALERLGVDIKTKENKYLIKSTKLKENEIVMYESGDTVTENVLMTAAKIPGKTTIKFASSNYQVQEMCFFLESLGIKIEGIGTTTLIVHGKKKINQDIEYHISEDPTDSMFFIATSIVTKSAITIKRCPIDFLELELLKLEKMGFKYKILKRYKSFNERTNLVDIKTETSTLTALEDKIYSRPYPGLNIDNLPFFAVIATQAKGQTLIHDWVYEKRAIYYTELDKLGAQTVLADPHRIFITGPTRLKSAELVCPPALRPATIILIAMLGAEGHSILRNIYSINRGYEDLVNRLVKLGAKVRILQEFTS